MKRERLKTCMVVLAASMTIGICRPALSAEVAYEEDPAQKTGGVKSLEKRIEQLETAVSRPIEGQKWYDRIEIGGLIEAEAHYQQIEYQDATVEDTDESDVDLATVELAVDARIVEHVDGHVLFKYEDDDLFVDEGFVTLSGTEAFPAYLIVGRQYVPFGNFASYFVTDPTTLILGETNEGAVVAGYRFGGEMVDLSAGLFNGKIDQTGDDDTIDSFVLSVTAKPLDVLTVGVSYTSNLASADAFFADAIDGIGVTELNDFVGGWSAFVTVEILDRITIIAEYMGALDDFQAGELYEPTDTTQRKPTAWNIEVGAGITEVLEVALRYGGSDDGADVLPETQYGVVLNWGFFKNTNLALEYLHAKFEDTSLAVDQEADTYTAQLAVEF